MTVDTTRPIERLTYVGPAVYPFNFKAYDPHTVKVYGYDSTGFETEWTYGVDYTVTLASQGGTIETSKPVSAAKSISIERILPVEQPTDWVNQGPFSQELLERNLDDIVMQIQQFGVQLSKATQTTWRDSWLPDTQYRVKDMVEHTMANNTGIYLCMLEHTSSSSFEDDLAAGYWNLMLEIISEETMQYYVDLAEQAAQEAQDSANAAALSADAANTSAQEASQSAGNAAISATESADSATESYSWAMQSQEWAESINPDEFYKRSDHISVSAGAADAGKPIVLNASGLVDSSMIDVGGYYYVGPFTPASGAEYPDTSDHQPGAYWSCDSVDDTNGYTFEGGDLAGQTIYNGDLMVWGETAWGILHSNMDPTLYYMLDGSRPITAPFAGGGQLISNVAPGVADSDAVTVSQLSIKADTTYVDAADSALQDNIDAKADITYVDTQDAALQDNIDAKADTTYVDDQDATLQTDINTRATTAYVDTQDNALDSRITDIEAGYLDKRTGGTVSGNLDVTGDFSTDGSANVAGALNVDQSVNVAGVVTGNAGLVSTGGGDTGLPTLSLNHSEASGGYDNALVENDSGLLRMKVHRISDDTWLNLMELKHDQVEFVVQPLTALLPTEDTHLCNKQYTDTKLPNAELADANLDDLTDDGLYDITNAVNPPPQSSFTYGGMLVASSGSTINQLWFDPYLVLVRGSEDGGATWSGWTGTYNYQNQLDDHEARIADLETRISALEE